MNYRYQYNTQEERQQLMTEHVTNGGKYLVLEENINEGNFLTFSDTPVTTRVVEIPQPITNADLVELQNKQLDIMQGMADIWTKLNGGVV